MQEHNFIIYRNGDPENVVIKIYAPLNVAQAIVYNIENYCAYGHRYTLRQI